MTKKKISKREDSNNGAIFNEKSDYLYNKNDELVHFIGEVLYISVLPDERIQIRFLMKRTFSNNLLFEINNSIVDCLLPSLRVNQKAPYEKLFRWVDSSLPVYTDGSINLVDLEGALVMASVKPRYVKRVRRFETKFENMVVMSLK